MRKEAETQALNPRTGSFRSMLGELGWQAAGPRAIWSLEGPEGLD